jgi:1-acyl-sn-glycerol-3-phosphate acyltransferase
MALEAGVKVLPVAMIGTDKAQPTGTKIPKLIRIGVKIGKPLDFSRYEGMEDDRFVLRSITDEIMYELMLLSGQEYVDMYATSMKDRIVAAAKTKARELQEAALPGSAAKELEEALDAGDDASSRKARPSVDDAAADIDAGDEDLGEVSDTAPAVHDDTAGSGGSAHPADGAGHVPDASDRPSDRASNGAPDHASDGAEPGARAAS